MCIRDRRAGVALGVGLSARRHQRSSDENLSLIHIFWTMKHVSGRTENCDCRKFKDDYDKELLVDPFYPGIG